MNEIADWPGHGQADAHSDVRESLVNPNSPTGDSLLPVEKLHRVVRPKQGSH